MYELLLERRAEKDLRKLPAEAFDRVIVAVRALAGDPRPSGARKLTGSTIDYRIRIGAYRVLYEVDDERKSVTVLRVRHRREAYRRP